MFLVSRLSLGFSVEEDRLRLVCESMSGERRVLWLTRRFVRRLLDELAKLVASENGERTPGLSAFVGLGGGASDDPGAAIDRVKLAQTSSQNGGGFLVTRVRLRLSRGAVSLGFMGEGDAVVQLDLESSGVQRWLELLAASCRVAQWSLGRSDASVPSFGAGMSEHPRVLH